MSSPPEITEPSMSRLARAVRGSFKRASERAAIQPGVRRLGPGRDRWEMAVREERWEMASGLRDEAALRWREERLWQEQMAAKPRAVMAAASVM
jgi:hypothetical protein